MPLVRTPSGAKFRAGEPGILPDLVARLGQEPAQARKQGDAVGAQATKILMNPSSGSLERRPAGSSHPPSPTRSPSPASTSSGWPRPRSSRRAIASSTATRTRSSSTPASPIRPRRPSGPTVCADHRHPRRRGTAGRVRRPELARARVRKVYAPSGCRKFAGARPAEEALRGAGRGPNGETLELVGLEAVRRDRSAVARRFQRELLQLVFHDQPATKFIRVRGRPAGGPVRRPARLPEGDPEAARVLHEDDAASRQGCAEAARRAGAHRHVRRDHGGARAAGRRPPRPDYDHYVTQQLRPIADALLHFLGASDFDTIAGIHRPEGRQLGLFGEGDLS